MAVPLRSASWQTEIKPGAGDNFTKAAFSLWLDDAAPPPDALLVITPGWNGDGRAEINSPRWQTFARENRLGLIGVFLQSEERDDIPPYHAAQMGSGAAFLNAVTRLSKEAGRPSLENAPLLFWGHSAGGQFGYGMACYAPTRVAAFAAIKGGVYLSKPAPGTYAVPGIFIVGEQDEVGRAMNITWLFETGRIQRAPWCLAFEPDRGHEQGRANALILPFFRGVLALGRRTANQSNKNISMAPGTLLGVRSSLAILKGTDSKGVEPQRTVWLPDTLTAKAWQVFSGGVEPP